MLLEAERSSLAVTNHQIAQAQDALQEQRLLLARLSAQGQCPSGAGELIADLERALHQRYSHRQEILNRIKQIEGQAAG